MTDAVAIALIGGLPLTLAAIGGLYVQLSTRGKIEVIQGHVNSEKTADAGRIAAKDMEIQLLREQIVDLKAAAGLLAQASAARARPSNAPTVIE
jgi:hypothetical protein